MNRWVSGSVLAGVLFGLSCAPATETLELSFGSMGVSVNGETVQVATGFGCKNQAGESARNILFATVTANARGLNDGIVVPPDVSPDEICMVTDVITWSSYDFDDVGELLDNCDDPEVSCRLAARYRVPIAAPVFSAASNRENQQQISAFLNAFIEEMSSRGVLADELPERSLVRVIGTAYSCDSTRLMEEELFPIPQQSTVAVSWIAGCAASAASSLAGTSDGRLVLDSLPGGLGPGEGWCDRCQVCRCALGFVRCAELYPGEC